MINRQWFVDALADRRQSQRALARYMELDASAITHILNGNRKLQLSEAEQIARFLGLPVDEILKQAGVKLKQSGTTTCSLVGTVDGQGIIKPITGLQVEAPDPTMAALQIHAGTSAFDGLLLFYRPADSYAPDILLSKIAVIEQPNCQRVGILRRGLTPGLYTISMVGNDLHDQPAKAASPVVWIKP